MILIKHGLKSCFWIRIFPLLFFFHNGRTDPKQDSKLSTIFKVKTKDFSQTTLSSLKASKGSFVDNISIDNISKAKGSAEAGRNRSKNLDEKWRTHNNYSVVITGFDNVDEPEPATELKRWLLEIFRIVINETIADDEIHNVHRIGHETKGQPRPVFVGVSSKKRLEEIQQAYNKLRVCGLDIDFEESQKPKDWEPLSKNMTDILALLDQTTQPTKISPKLDQTTKRRVKRGLKLEKNLLIQEGQIIMGHLKSHHKHHHHHHHRSHKSHRNHQAAVLKAHHKGQVTQRTTVHPHSPSHRGTVEHTTASQTTNPPSTDPPTEGTVPPTESTVSTTDPSTTFSYNYDHFRPISSQDPSETTLSQLERMKDWEWDYDGPVNPDYTKSTHWWPEPIDSIDHEDLRTFTKGPDYIEPDPFKKETLHKLVPDWPTKFSNTGRWPKEKFTEKTEPIPDWPTKFSNTGRWPKERFTEKTEPIPDWQTKFSNTLHWTKDTTATEPFTYRSWLNKPTAYEKGLIPSTTGGVKPWHLTNITGGVWRRRMYPSRGTGTYSTGPWKLPTFTWNSEEFETHMTTRSRASFKAWWRKQQSEAAWKVGTGADSKETIHMAAPTKRLVESSDEPFHFRTERFSSTLTPYIFTGLTGDSDLSGSWGRGDYSYEDSWTPTHYNNDWPPSSTPEGDDGGGGEKDEDERGGVREEKHEGPRTRTTTYNPFLYTGQTSEMSEEETSKPPLRRRIFDFFKRRFGRDTYSTWPFDIEK